MERSKREKRDEIPQGRFSSRPVSSAIELPELYLTVRGEEQDRYIEHLKCMLTDAPDRLSVKRSIKRAKCIAKRYGDN